MTTSPESLTWHVVLRLEELPTDGSGKTVEVNGQRIALFHHEGTVYCLDDSCPHQGASLGEGLISMTDVTCPWHGFHYDLATGANTDGIGECGVATHPVDVTDGGEVRVAL